MPEDWGLGCGFGCRDWRVWDGLGEDYLGVDWVGLIVDLGKIFSVLFC